MRISALALVALSGVLAACATTSTPQPKQRAQIQIQEQVGFTISEPVSVSDAVRMDYDSALLLLEQGQADEGIAILERVVAQAPDVSGPRIDLGIAAHQAGDRRQVRALAMLEPWGAYAEREALLKKGRQAGQTPVLPARLAVEVGDWMPENAIAVFDGVSQIGQYNVVVIDRGVEGVVVESCQGPLRRAIDLSDLVDVVLNPA